MCLQGITKYFAYFNNLHIVCDIIEQLRDIFVANRNESTKGHAILLKHELQFRFCYLLFSVMIFIVFLMLMTYPLPYYLLFGEKVLIYPMLLPMIDEKTPYGYALMMAIQIIWFNMACFGLIGADGVLCMFLVHIRPMVDLFALGFDELNNVLAQGKIEEDSKEAKAVELWLRNLTQLHQEITEYQLMSDVLSISNISCILF